MRVGIDVGTSVTKAVLFDDAAAAVEIRSAPTNLLRPGPGMFEFDVEQVVDSVVTLLRGLPLADVDLIAITGQGDGLWLLDADGRPVRHALAWLDSRGGPACREWERTGVVGDLFTRTGNAPFPGAGAALLAALDQAEPAVLTEAATATQCQHVLFQRLTGVRAATRSCAMLPVFDPVTGDYDRAAVRAAGIADHLRLLPDVAEEPGALATLRDDLADRLGAPRGTTVATGPYDLPAAALGVGALSPGDGLLILGTTLACQVRHDRVHTSGEPVGLTLCTGDGVGFLRAMPAMVGTAVLDWVLELVGADHERLDDLVAGSVPGAHGVTALPYLAPAGERAPFIDHAARAELGGLSLDNTEADVVRAMCEALGYAARHCFDAAGLTGDVAVCGGGTGSRELLQVFADILDRPLRVVRTDEPAARGSVAAALAATGTAAPPAPASFVEPADAAHYRSGYQAYLDRLDQARTHRWRSDDAPES